jgi:hypothetical protein
MVLALETKPYSLPSQMADRWQTVSQAHTGLGTYIHNVMVMTPYILLVYATGVQQQYTTLLLSSVVSAQLHVLLTQYHAACMTSTCVVGLLGSEDIYSDVVAC